MTRKKHNNELHLVIRRYRGTLPTHLQGHLKNTDVLIKLWTNISCVCKISLLIVWNFAEHACWPCVGPNCKVYEIAIHTNAVCPLIHSI